MARVKSEICVSWYGGTSLYGREGRGGGKIACWHVSSFCTYIIVVFAFFTTRAYTDLYMYSVFGVRFFAT